MCIHPTPGRIILDPVGASQLWIQINQGAAWTAQDPCSKQDACMSVHVCVYSCVWMRVHQRIPWCTCEGHRTTWALVLAFHLVWDRVTWFFFCYLHQASWSVGFRESPSLSYLLIGILGLLYHVSHGFWVQGFPRSLFLCGKHFYPTSHLPSSRVKLLI